MTMQNRQQTHSSAQQTLEKPILGPNGMPRGTHAQLYLMPAHPALVLPTEKLELEYDEFQVGRTTELLLAGTEAICGTWKRVKDLLVPDVEEYGLQRLILPVSMDADEQKRRNSRQAAPQEDDLDTPESPDRAVDSMSRSIRKWLWE